MLAKLAPPAIFFNTQSTFLLWTNSHAFSFLQSYPQLLNLVKNAFTTRHQLEFKKILTKFKKQILN